MKNDAQWGKELYVFTFFKQKLNRRTKEIAMNAESNPQVGAFEIIFNLDPIFLKLYSQEHEIM